MCLIQRVLVQAMGDHLREQYRFGGGGAHLAGAGMVQRADVRGQRGRRHSMGRSDEDQYS